MMCSFYNLGGAMFDERAPGLAIGCYGSCSIASKEKHTRMDRMGGSYFSAVIVF
jgi:hypothetical protein